MGIKQIWKGKQPYRETTPGVTPLTQPNYGTFVPMYFRYFRSMALSFPGTFAPKSENDVELLLPNTNYQWFIQTSRRPLTKFPTIDW